MKQHTLSRKEKLLNLYEFKKVYQRQRVKKGEFFWIYSAANRLGYSRLGISAGKRFCKNNIQRNKVKRLIRQYFQQNKAIFGQETDVVFVLKKLPEVLRYEKFKELLDSLI